MAFVLHDRIRENTTDTGTGPFSVTGAVSGYKSFGSRMSVGDTTFGTIVGGTEWVTGLLTYSASNQITVTTVYSSSNSDNAVSFSAGTKDVFIDLPAFNRMDGTGKSLLRSALGIVSRGLIGGLTLSTAGSSGTFAVAAGEATDSTNVDSLVLASAISKTTSSWAVGTGNGSLDTGTIANATWYHVYLIKRIDTQIVDVLVSLSASSPTMPANYTLSRRIGSMKTDGSAHWVGFTQLGDEFFLTTPVKDIESGAFGTSDSGQSLASAPSGIVTKAFINVHCFAAGAVQIYLRPNFAASQAPSFPNSPGFTVSDNSSGQGNGIKTDIWLDTSQGFTARSSSASTTIRIVTLGWLDRRGRDA